MDSSESKKRLVEGNLRFLSGKTFVKDLSGKRLEDLADNGQNPFALIVCCSDSRIPPEIVFDQGLGDIFVVRSAGNVVDEIGLGSIEYGALFLHIPLIIVLGHEKCGAVKATIEKEEITGSLKANIDKIRSSLEKIHDPEDIDIYEACTDRNILDTVDEIRRDPIINNLIKNGHLKVMGAKYGIYSGKVNFFLTKHRARAGSMQSK